MTGDRIVVRASGLGRVWAALFLLLMFPAILRADDAIFADSAVRAIEAAAPVLRAELPGELSAIAPLPIERCICSDSKFKVLIGTFLTAAGADISISMYQINRGTARERGFGAWLQDSPVAFGLVKSSAMAFAAYGLERVHRTRPKTAIILGIAATSLEMALVARGARLPTKVR